MNNIGRLKLKPNTTENQIRMLEEILIKNKLFISTDLEHNSIIVNDIEKAKKIRRLKCIGKKRVEKAKKIKQ